MASEADTYIRDLFGDHPALKPLSVRSPLPFFLTDKYAFLEGVLFGKPCVFMAVSAADLETPAVVAKHWSQVRGDTGDRIVAVLTNALSSHNRRRLISRRIPFLVPGNQLFIPDLAIDLREHFRAQPKDTSTRLTPVAQVLVLAAILGEPLENRSPSRLSQRFDYSSMSMGRVFDELQGLELAQISKIGRERSIAFHDRGRALWERARPMLQSPVLKSRLIARRPEPMQIVIAGESALALYTNLSIPRQETRAIPARAWKALSYLFDLEQTDIGEDSGIILQTWSYDPGLFSHDGTVDRLSLYLSLEDRRDERIDQAAEAMLDDIVW